MANVKFYKGLKTALPTTNCTDSSSLYFLEDSQEIYKSVLGQLPIKMSDYIICTILPVTGLQGKLYLETTTWTLNVWNGTIYKLVGGNPLNITASSVDTFTNKTIDATTNTISNIDLVNFKTGVISTDNTLVGNSDSTFSTTKAVKGYTDSTISTNLTSLKGGVATDGDTLAKLRGLIGGIETLLNSNDVSLDSLQEIVTYIKDNKTILDGVTTTKVNVSDIIDDLIHTDINKPLSANQGKNLKGLLDTLSTLVGTKADKVIGAVAQDIAILDVNGNLVDSGKKLSEYSTLTYTDAQDVITLNSSKSYSNAQDVINLASANNYTDSAIISAISWIDLV